MSRFEIIFHMNYAGLADSPVTEDVGGFNTTDVAAWLEGVSIAEELLPRSPAKLPSPLLRSPLSQALKASGISGEGGRGSVQEKGREVDPLPPSNLQSSKSKDADRGGSGGRNGREDNNAHYQEGSERHYKSPAPNKVSKPPLSLR